MIHWALAIICTICATTAAGQDLKFPSNAIVTREITRALDSYAMPVGPWVDGALPVETADGQLKQQAWTITATGLTTLQLIQPLRAQLHNDGFKIIYECRDQICGGFDFRFQTEVLPPPEMQVDLGNFRYFAARKDDGAELISVIASRSARAGFVQVTRIGSTDVTVDAPPLRESTQTAQLSDLSKSLVQNGHVVLNELYFETGSSRLGRVQYDTLQALADFLTTSPDLKIAIVGHTDSSGSLDSNITLSIQRAKSVLDKLVIDYNVNSAQLKAQGMGYLDPIASNQTQVGREKNRRVEVIITATN